MRGHEDYALWLRLATQGSFIYSPDTLVSYRRHNQQATKQKHYEMHMARAKLTCHDGYSRCCSSQPEQGLEAPVRLGSGGIPNQRRLGHAANRRSCRSAQNRRRSPGTTAYLDARLARPGRRPEATLAEAKTFEKSRHGQ